MPTTFPRPQATIKTAMEGMGATLEGDKWMYEGEPVKIIGLIRTEDNRKLIGEYFAAQLEGQGFDVTKQYGTGPELAPSCGHTAIRRLGKWHYHTGVWMATRIPCAEGDNFPFFYTNLWTGSGSPLWQAYVNAPAFYKAAERMWNGDYFSIDEYMELFLTCLPLSMKENQRMFLLDRKPRSPPCRRM
jgi:peptide/nickel transport system substrate-binding protein